MNIELTVAAYIIHEKKVLLVYHRKLDKWLPPGGHIHENETPDGALRREIREELGMRVAIPETRKMHGIKNPLALPFHVNVHNVGDHDHCCFFYICRPAGTRVSINRDELGGYAWFSAADLGKKIVPPDVRQLALRALRKKH